MTSARDWFTQNYAMSSSCTNPSKFCTSSLPLRRSITASISYLHKQKMLLGSVNVLQLSHLNQMPLIDNLVFSKDHGKELAKSNVLKKKLKKKKKKKKERGK
jgi:hypothetical protein